MTARVNFEDLQRWRSQATTERFSERQHVLKDDDAKLAFRAGLVQGWDLCARTLVLQGKIEREF
jgi:ribonuclease D